MPSIYLKQTQDYYPGESAITVQNEEHQTCKLFKKFNHTLNPQKDGNILIYMDTPKFWALGTNCLTIKPGSTHTTAKLKEAHVYYNQYDTAKTPLLFVLIFNGGVPPAENKYYTRSEFESEIRSGGSKNISDLHTYNSEQGILDDLLKENDSLDEPLTYNIGKKQGDSGDNGNYNGGKICVQDDTSKGEPTLSGTDFRRYKHTPVNGNGDKKACVIFDGNVLLKQGGTEELPGIQNQEYKEISVYFGTKAKVLASTSRADQGLSDTYPLLIKLTKKTNTTEPTYYVHKRDSSGVYYWEKLPGTSGDTLKNLLEDMGFSTENGEPGHKELHRILQAAGVNSIGESDNLSNKLSEVKGKTLQGLLGQTVGGDSGGSGSQKSLLTLLLTQIEFDLLDSVVILLEKKTGGSTYGEIEVSRVVSSLIPLKEINTIDMSGGKSITVSDATNTNGKCVQDYGYKLISHNFAQLVSSFGGRDQPAAGIRFIIPSDSMPNNYHQLKLYSNDKPEPQNLQYTYYSTGQNEVYVYYYNGDPRPLMVCYGKDAYKPRNLDSDNKETQVNVKYSIWEKVTTIKQCTCQNGGTTGPPNTHILDALNDVVGFLNPVQINPNEIPSLASGTITGGTGGKAEYNLHTYIPDKTIKMGITSTDVECYNKYTYQPYGTGTSKRDEGFRLGNVFHAKTSQDRVRSTLNYTELSTTNKYHPLVGVTVYYYDADKDYADPLLIELEFKTNGGVGTGPKEYYKLQPSNGGSSGTTLQWTKDEQAQEAISGDGDNQKLIEHLDSIRHSLKKVIKIYIDKTAHYELCVSQQAGGKNGGYSPNGGVKEIQVEEYNENGCSQLSAKNYKCYVHKLSKLNSDNGFDYNTIGGLKFYISGKTGDGSDDVEIPLHKDSSGDGDSGGGPLKEITYNKCMGDVYVYFYAKHSTKQVDDVPLMLRYNNGFYRPTEWDNYFTEWSYQPGLARLKTPCGTEREESGDSYVILATMLNLTNTALNRINLTPSIVSGITTRGIQYGIPTNQPPGIKPGIDVTRVDVTKIPNKDPTNRPYEKIVHRTTNGFTIGDIYYGDRDITVGVQINGGPDTIKVDGGGTGDHTTEFLSTAGNNKPNTVVAYYSNSDSGFKLPQLIVLLQTEQAIGAGTDPITATPSSKYGYYVLATDNGGTSYKYEWRTVDDVKPDPFKLDDPTEFQLLNSIIILVDQQKQYDEGTISGAVTNSKDIRSPGNESGVNRLKEKTINSTDYTNTGCKYIQTYGYKLYAHDIGTLVTWTGSNGQSIPLIANFRFLVPSSDEDNKYDEIKLYPTEETTKGSVDRLYHTPTNHNKIYVFFYGSDPRPLLICYGTSAYKPKKQLDPIPEMQVMVDYASWTRVTKISQCTCMGSDLSPNDANILNTLLEVVCFLNPVQLNPKMIPSGARGTITADPPKPPTPKEATYDLHKFTATQTVKMKITRSDIGCYEQFKYEPDGTGSGGTGFRLGNVLHTNTSRSSLHSHLKYSDHSTFPYYPVVGISVYYYDHDTKYEDPLLIQLDFKINIGGDRIIDYKEYYKLSKVGDATTNVDWALDGEAQKHIGERDTDNKNLINYLDKIRYQFKKVLEIKIATKKGGEYKANLLERNSGQPVEPQDVVQVQVTEEFGCQSLTGTGFRCFKHQITQVGSDQLHKFAALQFYIPDKDSTKLVKLNLHESIAIGPINPLYYNCSMGDIYVYFYGTGSGTNGGTDQNNGDPRPLLLCYNSTAYRATTIDEYDGQKWDMMKGGTDCLTNGNSILESLVCVSNFLNPLNIKMDQFKSDNTDKYTIHRFNGQDINIKVTKKDGSKTFCYTSYTHKHEKDGFRLGRIDYGSDTHGLRSSKCIKLTGSTSGNGDGSCINAVLDEPKKQYKSASQVVVYYFSKDTSYLRPLLVVLCDNETNGAVSKQYYELQRDSTNEPKKYKKETTPLDLNPSKNGQLERLLDKKLSGMNKSLQINLGFRARTTLVKYIGRSGKQTIKTIQNAYTARVYKNVSESKQVKTGPKIKVQVSGPTDISDETGNKTGYMCYRHKLTDIPTINNFGGLRLFLWDNRASEDNNDDQCKITKPTTDTKPRCCELDLHGDETQTSGTCSTTKKIEPIAYTTCKGDLYVYFYGSDPRPMLLCYNIPNIIQAF